jgi:hypothetical protein
MMEPLSEKELSQLLRQWKAPAAPAGLTHRVMPQAWSRWRWLLTGSVRVPVPVGIVAVLALVVWILWGRSTPEPVAQSPGSSTLADFQPVEQLQPTIVERNNENKQEYK